MGEISDLGERLDKLTELNRPEDEAAFVDEAQTGANISDEELTALRKKRAAEQARRKLRQERQARLDEADRVAKQESIGVGDLTNLDSGLEESFERLSKINHELRNPNITTTDETRFRAMKDEDVELQRKLRERREQ